MSSGLLANYRQLRAKVESLCQRIEQEQTDHIVCRRGCDSCCRHLQLFPVEAAALRLALLESPSDRQRVMLARAAEANAEVCPLLTDGVCLLYDARPIICRTHGLPLLVEGAVDYCPLNFVGVGQLPASAVIDLERLNELLATVNHLFVQESKWGGRGERLSIAETLCDERFDALLL